MKIFHFFFLLAPNLCFSQVNFRTTQNISGVINSYTPLIIFNSCDNKITVEDASAFKAGDTVLLIQMKGAVIDSTNTAAFGTVLDYKNAGNYEFNYVKSRSGNIIELKNKITRQYDIPTGKVQLVRVPYYTSVNITSALTCLPWDGNKGGILVLNVKDTITLNADIDVTGNGFKGAIGVNTIQPAFNCFENKYYYTQNGGDSASRKGEGITIVSPGKSLGKGKVANGGGSGNSHNSGGGGGSNGGNGGFGGYQYVGCGNAPFDNRGIGGTSLLYNTANKVFLGGGGGAGHDNATFTGSGGNGGGIALIISNYIISNGGGIRSNGANAPICTLTAPDLCHEGMGGGGAGGSVLLSVNNFINNLNISTQGGKGADMSDGVNGQLGPGGGGSGGIAWLKSNSIPANVIVNNAGGLNGMCTGYANDPWGTTPGSAGINLLNLAVPVAIVPFLKNIDSVRIKDSSTSCFGFNFNGSGYTNTNPVASWQWSFGDAATANTQNTSHNYSATGTYTVKLVVTDINGCTDSVTKLITVITCPNSACTDWLKINNAFDAVSLGDLDITGNKITVEASFNATGDITRTIVSKHRDPSDVNYHLLPDFCEVTTTNGYFSVVAPCDFVKNKTYHVSMVYDGATLTLYRNGFKMGSTPVTGNLVTNDWPAAIGENAYGALTQTIAESHPLKGFINEVRIWNVARTQAQIRTYMNSSLPTPSAQPGLQAYYIFDNLLNKQGNPAYNGILKGTASINATNTSCSFVADSCLLPTNISNIINTYTPVLALNPCYNKITVEDASTFNTGDTVLIIQMKGAVIDQTNTSNFGTITDYKNSGNYEFNYVKSKSGNIVELKNNLTRQYDIPAGKVQLVRVPYYTSATVTSTLTCLPWDGSKGGILVLNAKDNVNLSANIDVTGKGFNGGKSPNPFSNTLYCHNNAFYYAKGNLSAAAKGEGIAVVPDAFAWGKAPAANGGGGGNGHNSGGGGGGNGGNGGFGGYQLEACGNAPFDNRGFGGKSLAYTNAANKIFMGGGGGSGHTDNATGSAMPGGNGGGIIIIKTPVINAAGFQIKANGGNAPQCSNATNNCHDGSGGGGAGGTILLDNTSFIGNTPVDVSGGKGGDLVIFNDAAGAGRIGPGGGGGAGVTWFNNNSVPANVTVTKNGGANGVILQDNNNPWGATAGQSGLDIFNLVIPFDNTLFKTNIDSVRIKDSATTCSAFDFKGFGYTSTNPIASWQWIFGDGGTGNTQNTTHTYLTPGTFTVKLIVTDINGCTDSIIKPVIVSSFNITKSNDTTVCKNSSIQLFVSGGNTYSWSPAAGLSNPNIANPVATVSSPITYYITVTNALGCTKKDSIHVNIKPSAVFSISPDQSVCPKDPKQLTASGGTSYVWQPSTYLNNPNISNPVSTPDITTTYSVTIKESTCNDSALLTTTVIVLPLPFINASKTNDVDCSTDFSQLSATGGVQYLWQPAALLDDPNISDPVATPLTTTLFTVTGTDNNGCKNSDTITVNVTNSNGGIYYMPNAFTPNNDGLNDCFGLKNWGIVTKLEFSIYDRFGVRVFYTTDPSKCWDGRYKGIMQEVGMYVYILKATTTCSTVDKKGTLALIR